MRNSRLSFAGVSALVAAGVLLFAGSASAQRFGIGRALGGGVYPGYGMGLGWGNSYYGGYYPGLLSSNRGYYYPSGWNTASGWNGWTYPSMWGNGYGYGWNTNYNNYYGYQPNYFYSGYNAADLNQGGSFIAAETGAYPMNRAYTSFYAGDRFDDRNVPDRAALITMRVHPNAQVWFSGDTTHQTGHTRQFVTPSLEDGLYYYNIRARWNENGQDVERTRKVLVRPGDRIAIDMNRDMTAIEEVTPRLSADRERRSGYDTDVERVPRGQTETDRTDRYNEVTPAPSGTNINTPAPNRGTSTTTETTPRGTTTTTTTKPPASNPNNPNPNR